jgi:acyl carrier protein
MAHRLACIARDIDELCAALRAWLDGGSASNVHVGVEDEGAARGALWWHADRSVEVYRVTESGEALAELAELFVHGYPIDFAPLFASGAYRRIHLPTYPFAKRRHWVPAARDASLAAEDPTVQREALAYTRLVEFMTKAFADALYIPAEEVLPRRPIVEYGIDSVLGLKLMRKLEGTFDVTVTGTELLEHRTIEELARFLSGRVAGAGAVEAPLREDLGISDEDLKAFKSGAIDLNQMKAMLNGGSEDA